MTNFVTWWIVTIQIKNTNVGKFHIVTYEQSPQIKVSDHPNKKE